MTNSFSNNKIKINIDAIIQMTDCKIDDAILKKYDKDKNSIFSRDEVEAFLNDVQQYGTKDGDKETLSEKEALDFYNKLMSENDKDFKSIEQFQNGENPIMKILKKLNLNYDIQKTISTKYEIIDEETKEELQTLTEEQNQNVKKFLDADDKNILNLRDIIYFSKESDVAENALYAFNTIKQNRDKKWNIEFIELLSLSRLNKSYIDRIPRLLNIEGRSYQLSMLDIANSLNIKQEELESIIQKDPNYTIDKYDAKHMRVTLNNNSDEHMIFDNVSRTQVGRVLYQDIENDVTVITKEDFNTHKKRVTYKDSKNHKIMKIFEYEYDENKNLLRTNEIVEGNNSIDILVSSIDPSGNKIPVQWSREDSLTGERTIQRSLTSPDGTKSEYNFEQTSDGTMISEYKITDSDGNILLNQKRTYMQADKEGNKFISSLNGKVYEIEFEGNKIKILDKSANEMHIIDLTDKIENNNPDILKMLKRMPADMLLKMENRRLDKFVDDYISPSWSPEDKILNVRIPEVPEEEFETIGILMHEFGHFLDTMSNSENFGVISQNEDFVKIYKEEYANLMEKASFMEQEQVEYFTTDIGAMSELVAEANLIQTTEYSSSRAFYLQKFFPKTIAKAIELLNKA